MLPDQSDHYTEDNQLFLTTYKESNPSLKFDDSIVESKYTGWDRLLRPAPVGWDSNTAATPLTLPPHQGGLGFKWIMRCKMIMIVIWVCFTLTVLEEDVKAVICCCCWRGP